ncbi:hypothetical protein C900_01013 [Fulvivirga imtechensis AK7]|uniref:Uncharacterized protein n=1 Tax=Fulvivirga imtechensis AK7 TaxID=1237149 RepID=L8JYA8_9BACT|nr:hypothetical protein C900_01013 [Fulvivirga imtechensis AK7]
MRRDHKPYLINIGGFDHDITDDQMTNVYRVKRTKKQTYFHVYVISETLVLSIDTN